VSTTFQPGSGGGGGGGPCTCTRPGGGGGGGGGGALRIATIGTLTVTGSLLANGGAGGNALQGASGGGGGSGGVVHLYAQSLSVSGAVAAVGGTGGTSNGCGIDGGAGGLGRIRITAQVSNCSLTGSFNPPLVNGCTPTTATAGRTYIDANVGGLDANCVVGRGACQRTGMYVCTSGGEGTQCSVTPGAPSTEACGDGIDNDCDGTVDNGC
jgi:hypothetical protein